MPKRGKANHQKSRAKSAMLIPPRADAPLLDMNRRRQLLWMRDLEDFLKRRRFGEIRQCFGGFGFSRRAGGGGAHGKTMGVS